MSFTPSVLKTIEKHRLASISSATGTSPRTFTITLPKYGVYDFMLLTGYGNVQTAGVVTGRIKWFKNDGTDGSAGSANWIAQTVHDTVAFSGTTVANDLTVLTVSNPSSAGVITVTVEWGSAATSRTLFHEFTYSMPFDRMDFRIRT